MAKKVPEGELKKIWDVVADHPDGISVSGIAENLPEETSRRTLQHRLKLLVSSGRLLKIGDKRWTRYRVDGPEYKVGTEFARQEEYAHRIGLSEKAKLVRERMRPPHHLRDPVWYQSDFMDRYEPNSTFYLDGEERGRLGEIGKAPVADNQPAGSYAMRILNRLLIDLSWNSSRLEGNAYSRLEARRLIEFGLEASGKDLTDALMILNHKDAIEFLVNPAGEADFDRRTILNLHALLSDNLMEDRNASGRLRQCGVIIGQSVYHPLQNPQKIEERFMELLRKAAAIRDPFEQGFFAMVHMPHLQAFEDVNKRVSRLSVNIPLIRHNLAPLSFAKVPWRAYIDGLLGVYELNDVSLLKDVFMWAYEKSAKDFISVRPDLEEPDPFRIKYRAELRGAVGELMRGMVGRDGVVAKIAAWTEARIPVEDRDRFVQAVEDDLLTMHEGIFTGYRITTSEFEKWHGVWGTNDHGERLAGTAGARRDAPVSV